MKKMILLIFMMMMLAGCQDDPFETINTEQPFLASVNIEAHSVTFYDRNVQHIATWTFDKNYTGATLVGAKQFFIYGQSEEKAAMYDLSSGKMIRKIKVGKGTTNAIYDEKEAAIFVANGNDDQVKKYNAQGKELASVKVGQYPLSLVLDDNKLYVANFKDPYLDVIDTQSMKVEKRIDISKSSTGMVIVKNKNELWLGGHGDQAYANKEAFVYDLETGKLKKTIQVPLMPVGFAKNEGEIYIVSHATNMLYKLNEDGEILDAKEVGANPFVVTSFLGKVVVAGYDDQTIYVEDDGSWTKLKTDAGPFQLLVKE